MKNVEKYTKELRSYNSMILELNDLLKNRYANADLIEKLTGKLAEKKAYLDSFTVQEVKEALNADDLTKEDYAAIKNNLTEKKVCMKHEKTIEAIIDGDYGRVYDESDRIKKRRTLVAVGLVAGAVILTVLAAKGCNKNKDSRTVGTTSNTTVTSTVSEDGTVITSGEETTGTESVTWTTADNTNGTVLTSQTDPNETTNSNTQTTTQPTQGVTQTPTQGTTQATQGTTQGTTKPTAPSDNHPTGTTPYIAPTGTDPLPVEPTTIVDTSTPTPVPTSTPTQAPTSTPMPTPNTSNVVGPDETTYSIPSETSSVYIPTPVPTTTTTTTTTTQPTQGTTQNTTQATQGTTHTTSYNLPPVPDYDLPGQDEQTYDVDKQAKKVR